MLISSKVLLTFIESFYNDILDVLAVQYELVAKDRMCKGSHEDKGDVATEKKCATQCTNVGSMFIYALDGTSLCNEHGCKCYCHLDASDDGTCEQTSMSDYRLYRFTPKGIIV